MAKPIPIEAVRALGWTYLPLAVRVVTFDRFGRGVSNAQFSAGSIIREYERLARLGYAVGLVDVGDGWRDQLTVEQAAAQIAERNAALAAGAR
jgi:hypothetical protein